MSDGETPAALLAKLQARNRSEVDAFRAVFEAHAVAQRQARTLQERVTALQRQCAELGEGKENAEASLKTASEAAARGAAAQDQSARITELQAELAASYKQHAESSQQVIVAKDRLAKAEEELKLARETLAAVERERDEAIARGDDLDAALETSRAAAQHAAAEAESRLAGRDDALAKAEKLEAENAMLVERLMAIKVQEAEKMNEINDLYEDLKRQKKENELRAMASDLSAASAASMASLAGAETGAFVGQYFPARKRVAIRANAGGTHRVALTPGGDVLATAGDDKVIALWDADTGLATGPARLTGATGALLDADFSSGPDSREGGGSMMLLGAGTDRAVRLWDATSGRVRHTMTGHADKVCAARFNPWESTRAVSCAHDRTVKAWDLNKGFCVASIMCASNCNAVTYGDGASVVVSGHFDGACRVWDLRQKPGQAADPIEVKAHAQHVTSVATMPSNRSQFVTSSRDNTLKLVDQRGGAGEVVQTFRASAYRSGSQWANPCVSPDGRHVVAGGADGGVFVWSARDGGLRATLRAHDAAVATCAWGQRGLATADKNGVAVLWGA
jgi:autophagy-related protein 16